MVTKKKPALTTKPLTRKERSIKNKALAREVMAEAVALRVKPRKIDRAAKLAQKRSGNHPLMLDIEKWDREKTMPIICGRVATQPYSLKVILGQPYVDEKGGEWEMPSVITVITWKIEDPLFKQAYEEAKEHQADLLVDESLAIADNGLNDTYRDDEGNVKVDTDVLGRSKLRVETRRWIASKLRPRKYGDQLKLQGDPEAPLQSNVTVALPTDPIAAAEAYQALIGGKK